MKGIAVSLIGAISLTFLSNSSALAQSCRDFAYQEDAQARYSARLDRDGDGIACEHLPRRGYSSPSYSRPNVFSIPGWVYIHGNDYGSRVNVRSAPSTSAYAPHYGLVGDRVWATRTTYSEGYTWYFVGFPNSGATGWIRGDLIRR